VAIHKKGNGKVVPVLFLIE